MTTDHEDQIAALRRELQLAWTGHAKEHELLALSHIAFRAGHTREHELHGLAHDREHELTALALSKEEHTGDVRFGAAEAARDQLRDLVGKAASDEKVDALFREIDRRFDDFGRAITNIEKGDVKSEGRSLGQGAVVATIVTVVTVIGGLLGITIIVANFLAKP